jgi:hypothetical protein
MAVIKKKQEVLLMEGYTKKDLQTQYKNRTVVGGIYSIKCNGNGQVWLKSTKDLQGQKNKFIFFTSTNSCPEPGMRSDWEAHGAASFSFTVLEEITKKETQTDREFNEDLKLLLEMWNEKSQNEN